MGFGRGLSNKDLPAPRQFWRQPQPALKTDKADQIHSSGWGWLEPADVTDRGPVYDKRGKDDKLGVTCPGRVQMRSRAGERLLQAVGSAVGTNRCLSLLQSYLQGSAVARGGAIDLILSVVLPCAMFATSQSKGPGQGNTCSKSTNSGPVLEEVLLETLFKA